MTRVFWKILVDETNQHKSKVLSRESRLAPINNQTLKENTKRFPFLWLKLTTHNEFLLAWDEARR